MIQPYTLGAVDEQSDDSPINTTLDLHASDKDMSHMCQTASCALASNKDTRHMPSPIPPTSVHRTNGIQEP